MKIFVIGGLTSSNAAAEHIVSAGQAIGGSIARHGHSLVLCSPFEDAIDPHVLVGAVRQAQAMRRAPLPVEFVHVSTPEVERELSRLANALQVQLILIPQAPPIEPEGLRYSWLLCQLSALESCHGLLAIGGRPAGSTDMLLRLAESKGKPMIPFPLLGGAAEQSYYRRRYELADKLGSAFEGLDHEDSLVDAAEHLSAVASRVPSTRSSSPSGVSPLERRFFISYPRARACEADFVETILRRRGRVVFRDESDFGAGHAIPNEIREAIYASDVFIAIWCAEYACSPWCHDELNIALDRAEERGIALWIFCVDETRMVPPRARSLVSYSSRTRKELEGQVLQLLARDSF